MTRALRRHGGVPVGGDAKIFSFFGSEVQAWHAASRTHASPNGCLLGAGAFGNQTGEGDFAGYGSRPGPAQAGAADGGRPDCSPAAKRSALSALVDTGGQVQAGGEAP